jgi:hypothetical protein
MTGTPQSWKVTRHWLFDLATELAAAAEDGSLPTQLSMDRIWLTSTGGAKLLDFPAPGTKGAAEPLPAVDGLAFLNQVAITALEGRLASADEARTSAPSVPLPLPARDWLCRLRKSDSFAAIRDELVRLLRQRPAISRRRRLALIAGCAIPSLVVGAFIILGIMSVVVSQREFPDVMRLRTALINHERIEAGHYPMQIDPATGIEPLEIYIAGRFGGLIDNSDVWMSPYALQMIPSKYRDRVARIVAKHGRPSPQQFDAARAALGQAIGSDGELAIAPRSPGIDAGDLGWLVPIALGGFIWAAFFSLVAALFFRGGLLMRALGIAVVTADGTEASRGRVLWRACLAWSWLPAVLTLIVLLTTGTTATPPGTTATALVAAIGLPLIIVVAWSALRPDRSLPDGLAGTWLVPR